MVRVVRKGRLKRPKSVPIAPTPAPSAQTTKVGHLQQRGPPLFPRGGPCANQINFAEYAPF
jgi:hypothetical protein